MPLTGYTTGYTIEKLSEPQLEGPKTSFDYGG